MQVYDTMASGELTPHSASSNHTASQQSNSTASASHPSKATSSLGSTGKLLVTVKPDGTVVGPNSAKWQSRSGHFIRIHIPIHIKDWRIVPKNFKDDVWNSLMLEFEFDIRQDLARPLLEKAFPQKFRTAKTTYRKEIFPKYDSLEKTIEACPKGVDPGHWKEFVTREFTEKVKEANKHNAEHKRKNTIGHTLGRKSYGQQLYTLQQENPGKKIRRVECWDKVHVRSDGTVLESAKEKYELVKAAQERRKNLLSNDDGCNNEHDDDLDIDELVEVFGEDSGNRTRGVNSYRSKKQLQYINAVTTLTEQKSATEVAKVNATVANMQVNMADMKANMKNDMSNMKDLIGVMVQEMHKLTTTFQQPNATFTSRNKAGSTSFIHPSPLTRHYLSQIFDSLVPPPGSSTVTNGKVILLDENGAHVAKGFVVTDRISQNCHGKKVKLGEKKVYVDEVIVGDVAIYNAPQDGNLTLYGFVEGGYLIWLESRLKFS